MITIKTTKILSKIVLINKQKNSKQQNKMIKINLVIMIK